LEQYGALNPEKKLLPQHEIIPQNPKQRERLEYAKKHSQVDGKEWSPLNMIGRRVEVKWTQANAKGWFSGIITDFDEITKKLFVKYDIPDKETGKDTYGENLLGVVGPEWVFEDEEINDKQQAKKTQKTRK
jgi:hypothetical protein